MKKNIKKNDSCQVKKRFSYAICYGLINECTKYIESIYKLKNNFIKANENNIKLGNKQEELLIYLYKNYFTKRQPCYATQSYLAKRLNMHRSHLNRTIKFLEEKKLIYAIPFFFKSNKVRTIIIPIIPETEILVEGNQNLIEPVIKKQIEILTSYLNKLMVNTTSKTNKELVHIKGVRRVPIMGVTCTNQIFKLLNLLEKKKVLYIILLYILFTNKEILNFFIYDFSAAPNKSSTNLFFNFCLIHSNFKNLYINNFDSNKTNLDSKILDSNKTNLDSKILDSNKTNFDLNFFETEFNKLLDSNLKPKNFDSKLNIFVSKLILQMFGFDSSFIEQETDRIELMFDSWLNSQNQIKLISSSNVPPPGENTERIIIMPKRLNLKVKQNTLGIHKHIFNLLQKSDYEFDKLSVVHQNTLNEYVNCFHSIDIRDHFKISKKGSNKYYNEYAIKIRQMLLELIINNKPFESDYVDQIINYWNGINLSHDKAIKKVNPISNHTKVYKNVSITISHALNWIFDSDMKLVFRAIKRLEKSEALKRPPFTRGTQITLDRFLLSCGDTLNAYLKPDNEFNKFLYSYKVAKRHVKRVEFGYKRFCDMYVDNFYAYDVEKGEQKCYDFEHMIKRWMEHRISEIVDPRRKGKMRQMHGYSLVSDGHDGVEDLPPLLVEFFMYVKQEHKMLSFKRLFEHELWKDFISYMKDEVVTDDFYYIVDIEDAMNE